MWRFVGGRAWALPAATGVLDPTSIPKYQAPLVIPPPMPGSGRPPGGKGGVDFYRIAVREFRQQILPASMGLKPTRVWGYGSVDQPATFNYPAFTIEATYGTPVRVKWINDLVKPNGEFRPHLLPIDQTLHWANPPGGARHRDQHGSDHAPYRGPVPIVTHLHGGHTSEESDGYPEAWYLPDARNIPAGYARTGSLYRRYRAQAQHAQGQAWTPGSAVFQYDNETRARTEWFHDHALGITRANVYAGPAGFYLLRGGPGDAVVGTLPGPAPGHGDPPYFEIPIVIQDRSFTTAGELFYPDNRAFFEGLDRSQLRIPFMPDPACGGPSDVAPIWNPEFFGDSIVVNGATWPYLEVQRRRYRFRFLNGCNARFLILRMGSDLPFWQIGNDGGFLPTPVEVEELLLGPAERADVIVDFTNVPAGSEIILKNLAPDEPFGGGTPGEDFDQADPETTGQVMLFRVISATAPDPSTPPEQARPAGAGAARRRDQHPPGLAQRAGVGNGSGQHQERQHRPRLRERGAVRSGRSGSRDGQPERHRQPARLGRADHREPGGGSGRSVGDLQLHRRRAPDPHSRDHLRGGEPPADRRRRTAAARQRRAGPQGHGHRLPGRDHPGEGAVRPSGPLRLALPHPRA